MKRMFKRYMWWFIGGLAVILIGGSSVYAHFAAVAANKGVSFSPHVTGNPNATVTLTEYSDFVCPACEEFYPHVENILKQYGNKIRFEYKFFPLIGVHQNAVPAATAAETAAQQGKFFAMYNELFSNASQWANSPNPMPYFDQYAQKIGLNMNQFHRQFHSSLIKDKIMKDYKAAQALGLTSTPTFFLNGQKMTIKSYQQFQNDIAAAVSGTTTPATASSTPTAATTGGVQFGL